MFALFEGQPWPAGHQHLGETRPVAARAGAPGADAADAGTRASFVHSPSTPNTPYFIEHTHTLVSSFENIFEDDMWCMHSYTSTRTAMSASWRSHPVLAGLFCGYTLPDACFAVCSLAFRRCWFVLLGWLASCRNACLDACFSAG